MNQGKYIPRILIIDDLFGRTHKNRRNEERSNLCGQYLLEDITGDEIGKGTHQKIKRPIAQAIFYRGQRPVNSSEGDIVENDLEGVIDIIAAGWNKPPYWSLVLLDLCFYTGKVTNKSNKKTRGMPEGRDGDDNPTKYFGLRLLEAINEHFPNLPVVILSSKPHHEVSREISFKGAPAFIPRADENSPELLQEYIYKYGLIPDKQGEIIGQSKKLLSALRSIRLNAVAGDRRHMLLRGERGTGKELIARYIHRQRSQKGPAPFVTVNSSILTQDLFASELFGIKSNTATGVAGRTGLIQEASGGELFLDEITDMLHQVQAGILRVLQENVITPIGAKKSIPVDVSFLSATNMDIEALAAKGDFRNDLLDRLRDGGTAYLPPLRERKEDISLLVEKFVRIAERESNARHRTIEPEVIELLLDYDWPGNIRELRSCIFSAIANRPDVEYLVPVHITLGEQPSIRTSNEKASDQAYKEAESISPQGLKYEEGKLPAKIREYNMNIVHYIWQALEDNKDKRNGSPRYPQTWFAMTGEDIRNSSICQRNIGNYIFTLADEKLIPLMKQSGTFEKAVFQCGNKIHSAKRRLSNIEKLFKEIEI